MKNTLKQGLQFRFAYKVRPDMTVPHVFPDSPTISTMPDVLATGNLVAIAELACIEALAPHLDAGEGSIGAGIAITHSAPTPPGEVVEVDVICTGVEGRKVMWSIAAKDEQGPIGEGTHTRFVVTWDRFNAKLAERRR